MKNKLLALLCSLAVLISGVNAYAASTDSGYADECMKLLSELYIADTASWADIDMAKGITRAEAASVFYNIIENFGKFNVNGAVFSDVTANHKYAREILNVTKYKIMNAGGGKFRPSELLSLGEMTDSCMHLLGTAEYAEKTGADISVLPEIKYLYKNISDLKERYLTKQEFCIILLNALKTEMREIPVALRPRKELKSEITMLEYYMNIRQIRGIVTANRYTALPNYDSVGKNDVRIGETLYGDEGFTAGQYLGMNVDAYVKIYDDYCEVIACYPRKNTVLTIDGGDLLTDNRSFSLKNIVYRNENGKKDSAGVDGKAAYIFNNVVYDGLKANELADLNGSITLTDYNNDGVFDIISVTSYENYTVDSVDMANNIIYGKDNKSFNVSDKYRFIQYFGPEGRSFRISQLKEWQIITVKKSKDYGYLALYLSVDEITGTVTETEETSDGKTSFCVTDENGEKHYLVTGFSDKNSKYMPKLNDEGIFYINYFGEYISGQKKPAAAQYAFVLGAAVMNDMDDEVSFNLVFQDGSKKICKVPNGIILNKGTVNETSKLRGAQLAGEFSEQQLALVKINSKNVILSIDKAYAPSGALGYDDDSFTLDGTSSSEYYYNSQLGFGYDYGLSGSSYIFLLDNTDGNGEFTADDVTVVNRNGLKDNMKYSAIKYYDTDVLRCARAVVANIGEGRRQNKFAVFEKYLSQINDAGVQEKCMSILTDGVYTVLPIAEGTNLPALKKGELILVYKNYNGYVTKLDKVSELMTGSSSLNLDSGGMRDTALGIYRAKIAAKNSERICLLCDGALVTLPLLKSAYTYVITDYENSDRVSIEVAGVSRLNASLDENISDEVYVLVKYNQVNCIAVYQTVNGGTN